MTDILTLTVAVAEMERPLVEESVNVSVLEGFTTGVSVNGNDELAEEDWDSQSVSVSDVSDVCDRVFVQDAVAEALEE